VAFFIVSLLVVAFSVSYLRSPIQSMKQRPLCGTISACSPQHPAVAYLFLVRRIHARMKSDEPEQGDFVLLGSYPPREVAWLLERFPQAAVQ
jgi:hypothetical protein